MLVVAAVLATAGMAWTVLSNRSSVGPARGAESVAVGTTSGTTPFSVTSTTARGVTAPSTVVVDVQGAVRRPGLVRVPASVRVAGAIDAAGGATGDADLERLNRAAPVTDGARIYVPRRGEHDVPAVVNGDGPSIGSTDPGAAPDSTGPVNLNTATAVELDALPGVGPSTAQAIIEYRSAHGPFATVEDLMDVRGIGVSKFAALKAHVTV